MHTQTLRASALTLLLLTAAAPLAAQRGRGERGRTWDERRVRIDTTFAFDKTGAVDLEVITGEIRVTGWDRNEIRIVATTERGALDASFSNSRVAIEVDVNNEPRPGQARFEVNVPFGVRVRAEAVAGNVIVTGTRGEVTLETTTGNVEATDVAGAADLSSMAGRTVLQRFRGDAKIENVSGPVSVSEVSGTLVIEQVSGSVRVERAELDRVEIETIAGTVDLGGTLAPNGRHTIGTTTGAITLRVPGNFAATVEFETTNGQLHPGDFAVTTQGPGSTSGRMRNNQRIRFAINGGGTVVRLNTLNGDVFLRRLGATERE